MKRLEDQTDHKGFLLLGWGFLHSYA